MLFKRLFDLNWEFYLYTEFHYIVCNENRPKKDPVPTFVKLCFVQLQCNIVLKCKFYIRNTFHLYLMYDT